MGTILQSSWNKGLIKILVFNYDLIQGYIDKKGNKLSLNKVIEKRLISQINFG